MNISCPCQSQKQYDCCCEPFHKHIATPNAEELMRSRYSAYVLHDIDYIIETTVPSQQSLLNRKILENWSNSTQWLGLDVLDYYPKLSDRHAQVFFRAYFWDDQKQQCHEELSTFVKINQQWYFIDPTVTYPSNKQPCLCGSGKKFKACCGRFLK